MHELEAIGGKNPFSPPLAFFGLAVVYVYVQGREKLKAIDLLSSAINFQLSCWDKNFWAKNGSSREREIVLELLEVTLVWWLYQKDLLTPSYKMC